MKRTILFLIVTCIAVSAADLSWQFGRIASVRKRVTSGTRAWVVNTPIPEEHTAYTIAVHLQNAVVTGNYEPGPEEAPPPPEWSANYPIKVQIDGEMMYLRSPLGDVRAHITRRKNAPPMLPLTTEEKKQLAEMDKPAQSLIGFSNESGEERTAGRAPAEAPPQAQAAAPANVGTVNVRSVPYLSEIFVDGDSMGYTPAKINLAPGKHTFRIEKQGYKPWTKEMTVTAGSELTVDASLERK